MRPLLNHNTHPLSKHDHKHRGALVVEVKIMVVLKDIKLGVTIADTQFNNLVVA
jgi:hypothetical protein